MLHVIAKAFPNIFVINGVAQYLRLRLRPFIRICPLSMITWLNRQYSVNQFSTKLKHNLGEKYSCVPEMINKNGSVVRGALILFLLWKWNVMKIAFAFSQKVLVSVYLPLCYARLWEVDNGPLTKFIARLDN